MSQGQHGHADIRSAARPVPDIVQLERHTRAFEQERVLDQLTCSFKRVLLKNVPRGAVTEAPGCRIRAAEPARLREGRERGRRTNPEEK